MSYSITVAVKDGSASVTTSGPVPDGEFQVNGHDDATRRDLGVIQRHADGRYAGAANTSHYKET